MPRFVKRKLSKKEQKAALKTPSSNFDTLHEKSNPIVKEKRKVEIPDVILVKDFAEKANLPVAQVITQLMKSGVLANLNETIDFDTAAIIGDDLNLEIVKETESENVSKTKKIDLSNQKNLVSRPPVVTIMGHVDHGKTSLLDKIRETKVVESESGGITQHISAYQITLNESKNKNLKNRTITFIDTPGHAAFSAMREHGAVITDIIVLIVAANDGVMPQTIEVINKSKENNVPVIVAINKTDLPDADVMKVKQQLSEYELVPEEWGGKTVMVSVSAKTGAGIDDLLEMILLQTDLMNLVADPTSRATGTVIESYMSKGSGSMALVLIENGTLKKGDPIAIGKSYGKVRMLEDFNKKNIDEAGPSAPVRVAGLKSLPNFGDRLVAFENEKEARENAFQAESFIPKVNVATAKKIEHADDEQSAKELNIILKADVAGSLEAIKKSIYEINSEEIEIKIVAEGVGAVSESDVTLAEAINAVVIGFRIKVLGAAKKIADKEGIKVKTFDVIYELITDIKEELSEMLAPEVIEEEVGRGKVLAIFRDDRKGFVAGGMVESGRIAKGDEIKFLQNDNDKYRDKIQTLRKEKSEAKECESGTECGFGLTPGAKVAVGDVFIAFHTIEKKRVIQ